jgi:hypothetical protein
MQMMLQLPRQCSGFINEDVIGLPYFLVAYVMIRFC